MEIVNLSLPATNRFATEYLKQSSDILSSFHYRYNGIDEYKERLKELMNRTFLRNELANHIEHYMEPFTKSEAVKASLEKLRLSNSTVVIGGQQAGLLTGPLYSIHKVISIIALAKEKEKELNSPVVPVFWIAGEDHDYQEVNHVYAQRGNTIEKMTYPEKVHDKRMVSDIGINKEICLKWANDVIETFGETAFTNELLGKMEEIIGKSASFVDFFAHLIMYFFEDTGLLLIDSGDEKVRKLEKEFFIKQIQHAQEITKLVIGQQADLKNKGFMNAIEISSQAANLFYYDKENFERILLEFDKEKNVFIGKDGSLEFTVEEMIEIASEYPEKLSNNVVTRPMMQEWLFPTLAFIAGPGEIAYWAELKAAFELFGLKMPPIMPRLNITLLERSVETDINELGLDLYETLTVGTEKRKREFIKSLKDEKLENLFDGAKRNLLKNYCEIKEYLEQADIGLLPLIKKNEDILIKQLMFMEQKLDKAAQLKHEVVINKFERVENALWPAGSPQERILNGLYYANHYGKDFFKDLLDETFSFDGTHKVIKI